MAGSSLVACASIELAMPSGVAVAIALWGRAALLNRDWTHLDKDNAASSQEPTWNGRSSPRQRQCSFERELSYGYLCYGRCRCQSDYGRCCQSDWSLPSTSPCTLSLTSPYTAGVGSAIQRRKPESLSPSTPSLGL